MTVVDLAEFKKKKRCKEIENKLRVAVYRSAKYVNLYENVSQKEEN